MMWLPSVMATNQESTKGLLLLAGPLSAVKAVFTVISTACFFFCNRQLAEGMVICAVVSLAATSWRFGRNRGMVCGRCTTAGLGQKKGGAGLPTAAGLGLLPQAVRGSRAARARARKF